MSSVPYSIRLPSKLVSIIDIFAKKTGKNGPDTVRTIIEQIDGNEYRFLVCDCLKEPREVLQRVRTQLANKKKGEYSVGIAPQDYSALMHFWHYAYMTGQGYAKPEYVMSLLDITSALLSQLGKFRPEQDLMYFRSTLNITAEESFRDGIARVKGEFSNNPSVSWAEMLTRPLEALADELQFLDKSVLPDIFDSRIEQVLPVAVRGANATVDCDIIERDMESLLPEIKCFDINGMTVQMCAQPLSIIVEEGKYCYAFQGESALGFAAAISGNVFVRMMAPDDGFKSWARRDFDRKTLHVQRLNGQVIIHEHGGYRLFLKDAEFQTLILELKKNFESAAWVWLIKRHHDLRGDY